MEPTKVFHSFRTALIGQRISTLNPKMKTLRDVRKFVFRSNIRSV